MRCLTYVEISDEYREPFVQFLTANRLRQPQSSSASIQRDNIMFHSSAKNRISKHVVALDYRPGIKIFSGSWRRYIQQRSSVITRARNLERASHKVVGRVYVLVERDELRFPLHFRQPSRGYFRST